MRVVRTLIILISVLVIGDFFLWYGGTAGEQNILPQDFKEVTFMVSGTPVTLTHGVAQVTTALGGSSITTIRYFGNELVHDVDGDGADDVVFLITQETGRSGTFFYAVAALWRGEGYVGSHAVFLGDRIAPQTTEKGPGRQVFINFAERAPGEPMTARPSVGKSIWLLLDPTTLEFGEVV